MKKFIIALCLLDAHGIMFASQQQKKPTLSMVQEINNKIARDNARIFNENAPDHAEFFDRTSHSTLSKAEQINIAILERQAQMFHHTTDQTVVPTLECLERLLGDKSSSFKPRSADPAECIRAMGHVSVQVNIPHSDIDSDEAEEIVEVATELGKYNKKMLKKNKKQHGEQQTKTTQSTNQERAHVRRDEDDITLGEYLAVVLLTAPFRAASSLWDFFKK